MRRRRWGSLALRHISYIAHFHCFPTRFAELLKHLPRNLFAKGKSRLMLHRAIDGGASAAAVAALLAAFPDDL